MTALLGYGGMFVGIIAATAIFGILYKLWENGILKIILFFAAIGAGLYCAALAIHEDAMWIGEKIQGAIG